jgi:hypothetical protein
MSGLQVNLSFNGVSGGRRCGHRAAFSGSFAAWVGGPFAAPRARWTFSGLRMLWLHFNPCGFRMSGARGASTERAMFEAAYAAC